jgi:hypothetical protein
VEAEGSTTPCAINDSRFVRLLGWRNAATAIFSPNRKNWLNLLLQLPQKHWSVNDKVDFLKNPLRIFRRLSKKDSDVPQ